MVDAKTHRTFRLARRDLLKMGVISPIVAGIGSRLIGEARGAPVDRKVLITLVSGSTFPMVQRNLTQQKVNERIAERLSRDPDLFSKEPGLEATWSGYYDRFKERAMLPASLLAVRDANEKRDPPIVESLMNHSLEGGPMAPFESRKDRMLYFSRLYATGGNEERGGWSHGGGMRVLSANGTGRIPRNATIDQHIANVIGSGTAEKSIRISVDRHSASSFNGKERNFQNVKTGHFAAGNQTALPGYSNPILMFQDLFGAREAAPSEGDFRRELRTKMFDHLSSDIRRLSNELAGTEKQKLDVILSELDAFAAEQDARLNMTCDGPRAPENSLLEAGGHAHATFMMELGALAIRCGLTNVMSVAIGAQPGSHEPMWAHGGYPMGHNIMHYGSCYQFWEDYMALIGQILDDFDQVESSGGRTLADDTTVMMMGDGGVCNYSQHVGEMKPEWIGCGPDFPLVVIAPKDSRLRGGTFFQYPGIDKLRGTSLAESDCTSQASVFRTVGEVLGAPGFEGNEICYARTMTEALAG